MPNRHATDAELLAIAPELSVLDPAYRLTWLELTECEILLVSWGEKARDAHRLLTAHVLTESPAYQAAAGGGAGGAAAGGSGAVASMAVGPASISWATSPTTDAAGGGNYHTTSYGRRFANMLASMRPLPRIARRC